MSNQTAASEQRLLPPHRWWVALTLAAIAGGVDGIGYLLLAHIFTSHMSGNTVAMTMYVASRKWSEAWRHIAPIVIFFLGIVAGIGAVDVLVRRGIARTFAIVAGVEVSLLLAFLILAHPPAQWMVVWPAAAMGVQNALLRRVGAHSVRTTFITGMLANTAEALVAAVASTFSRDGKAGQHSRDFGVYAAIWLCFAGGGIAGAFWELGSGSIALVLPIAGLVVLIVYDAVVPLTFAAS